jgi:hypothetical protein
MMPLAPATTLMARFPDALQQSLDAGGFAAGFIEAEIAGMIDIQYAKTANRSVIGIMNEFSYLAKGYRDHRGLTDLVTIGLLLSETPCGPLYQSHGSPNRELDAAVAAWSAARPEPPTINGET